MAARLQQSAQQTQQRERAAARVAGLARERPPVRAGHGPPGRPVPRRRPAGSGAAPPVRSAHQTAQQLSPLHALAPRQQLALQRALEQHFLRQHRPPRPRKHLLVARVLLQPHQLHLAQPRHHLPLQLLSRRRRRRLAAALSCKHDKEFIGQRRRSQRLAHRRPQQQPRLVGKVLVQRARRGLAAPKGQEGGVGPRRHGGQPHAVARALGRRPHRPRAGGARRLGRTGPRRGRGRGRTPAASRRAPHAAIRGARRAAARVPAIPTWGSDRSFHCC